MKKFWLMALGAVLMSSSLFAQQQNSFNEPCLTEYMFREYAQKDPSLYQKREEMEKQLAAIIKKRNENSTLSGDARIIPVVFHVIYENACGTENISKEQIEDQIRILNQDYRRLNADTNRTPGPFKSKAADTNIEFRLAKKDPNGNCTDGIVRVQSNLTNDARDNVKAVSYWDSKRYLNIWSVKSINGATPPSYVLGYAQFPGLGDILTDGIVLRSDVVGSIGTGASSWNSKGRTASHEVGHWLNLRHIWGDFQCGNDQVSDTPVHTKSNSGCPGFPKINTCAAGDKVNGEMFTDYMDYTDGACQNMFSIGQSTRMNGTLDSARKQLCSPDNLVSTGVLDSAAKTCTPIVDFCYTSSGVCEGTTVNFADKSWNGAPTAWTWLLPGSDLLIATTSSLSAKYSTPGTYDVTLIVSNQTGQDTIVQKGLIKVIPTKAQFIAPFTEDFETPNFATTGWTVENKNNDPSVWQNQSGASAINGTGSVKLNNIDKTATGAIDNLISPSQDFTNITTPGISYYYAYAYKSSSSTDVLKMYSSENCGKTWALRFTRTAAQMKTAANTAQSYLPQQGEWKQLSIKLPSLAGIANVLFKFEFTSGTGGNNLYLDKINMGGYSPASGINNEGKYLNSKIDIYPNPANKQVSLSLNIEKLNNVKVEIVDVTGRVIKNVVSTDLNSGQYLFEINIDNAGVYFVKTQVGDQSTVSKLVIQ